MQFYQEITLLQNPEISFGALWAKVYRELHLELAKLSDANGCTPIGVSFPEYGDEKFCLGQKLRLFARDEADLSTLNLKVTLRRFDDYIHITRVRPVPSATQYAIYSRWHQANNAEQKARRYARRHNVEYAEAKKLFSRQEFSPALPYINMESRSNGQFFRLYITQRTADAPYYAGFSAYGLSGESTVPIF